MAHKDITGTGGNRNYTLGELIRLTSAYLALVSSKYGGETTINELRVMNRMISLHHRREVAGVMRLSKMLGIPKSTVSRSVTHLISTGHLAEQDDPNDRRRRLIALSQSSIGDLIQEVDFLEHFEEYKDG